MLKVSSIPKRVESVRVHNVQHHSYSTKRKKGYIHHIDTSFRKHGINSVFNGNVEKGNLASSKE